MPAPSIQSIVVGYDGTERCEPAVVAGLELGRRFRAAVEVVHVVPIASPLGHWGSVAPLAPDDALTAVRKHLFAFVQSALERYGYRNYPVEDVFRVLSGSPAHVLLDRAAETEADLIVLGPHRKRGLFNFGSTARAVLSGARKAVWVQPTDFRVIRHILVPVDLSQESLAALGQACALARELGADIETLHCFPPPDFAYAQGLTYPAPEPTYVLDQAREATRQEYERAMASFDWGDLRHVHDFREGDPITSILEKQSSTDLVVMGTHGRTGLSAAVLGNVAYGVLKAAEVPVLAIRHPGREFLT